ncbi:hypothetical protein ACIGW3_10045 [Streptomyces sp. NPDC053499]|uniref:hypothetical protein n=1 Tax=Streptomyces sp. NPDC053499 TaxID=3365707 RepID=UPI0037D1AA0F
MSFGQEWAGLVANARTRQSTSTQLNGAGGQGGGEKGDGKWLQLTESLLESYAGKVETVGTAFQKVDNAAMRETEQVPGSMKGFASDEAFKQFQKMWRGQMAYVKKRYAAVAGSLQKAAKDFKATDVWTKEQVERIEREKHAKDTPPGKPGDLLRPNNSSYLLDRAKSDFPLTQVPNPPLLNPDLTDKPPYGPLAPTPAPTSEPKS